jgi:galactose-1-phosphate uridylyltransferase
VRRADTHLAASESVMEALINDVGPEQAAEMLRAAA